MILLSFTEGWQVALSRFHLLKLIDERLETVRHILIAFLNVFLKLSKPIFQSRWNTLLGITHGCSFRCDAAEILSLISE